MIATLRGRVTLWAVTFGGLVVAGALVIALVLQPAFRRADQTLAPFAAIFPALAERQAAVASAIEALTQRLTASTTRPDPGAYVPPEGPSLVAVYARALTPEAAAVLAYVERDLAALETQLGLAFAALEVGNRQQARSLLAGIEEREAGLAARQREQMLLAFTTGADARQELQGALRRMRFIRIGWLALVGLAAALLVWDLRRRVLRPIRDLEDGVERLGRGDWTRTVPERGDAELRRLARHFNAMVDVLRRRAGRQAQFATAGELLSGAAHELNNPLQAIRSLAELRRDGATGADREDWDRILSSTERASRLVRDLGRFTRPAGPSAGVHQVNNIVRSALGLIEFQFAADGIEVRTDLSERVPPVLCDEHDLVQALVNLLANAHAVLRGRPQPRRVEIATWRDDGFACIRIHDTGPGIPEHLRDHLFDPFFTTKADGVGLGLSAARDVVEGEGGRILLEPASVGAAFTIRLPAAPGLAPKAVPLAAPPSDGGSLQGLRVLIVDDESAVRDVLRRFLEREGAEAIVAAGGQEALARAGEADFDAAILDLRMPDIEGARVYDRWLRDQPALARRTLVLSGDLTRLDTAEPVPPQRILTKPVELSALRQALLGIASGA